MCKLVTRSTPYWPCEGWRLQLFPSCFDGSLGVCSLHPSVQGPDDRSRLSGVFRLYICSGWNEMHQNWRKWQKQRQDCLFRWCQFYPKWWVEWGLFSTCEASVWSHISDEIPLLSSCAGLCSLSACSLYAHQITSEFFDPLFVAQKWEKKQLLKKKPHIFTRIKKKIP